MYWYNPKSRTSERVAAPTSDMQAIQMACTHSGFCRVCKGVLRATPLGTPIEQALVLLGHEFRLRQPEYQLVLR